MKDVLVAMLRHMAWADRRLGEALLSAGDAVPEKAVGWYAHVAAAELVWLSRLEGREGGQPPIFPQWDAAAAAEASAQAIAGYERFIEEAADLERMIVYHNSTGTEFHTAVSDILTHVFLHGSYHRGQVNLLLRGAGAEPVNVDYITFVRSMT